MLINRSELRLAITAGLATGFTLITALPFGVYFTTAVLAVCTGTYGGSLAMSWQRIAGTLLGGGVLLACYGPMQGWPFPLAIAVALTLLRLLGGWLGIRGYKVGSFIVIMGWLVHNDQLAFWIPMRLFWTTLGILVGMWSLRLFWCSLAISNARSLWSALLTGLGDDLRAAARRLDPHPSEIALAGSAGSQDHAKIDKLSVQRRQQLVQLRKLMPEVANELGNNPQLHPLYRLFRQLDRTSSLLIGTIDGLAHQPIPRQDLAALVAIHGAEASVLRYSAERLDQWILSLAKPGDFPPPPGLPPGSTPLPERWEQAASLLQDTSLDAISPERLQHLARRALLCRQSIRAIESMEQDWSRLARR
jgi:uncharacterized membrane protein YccC